MEILKDTYDAGMNTSTMMQNMLFEMLVEGEKLPKSLNEAIYALKEGRAYTVKGNDAIFMNGKDRVAEQVTVFQCDPRKLKVI